MLATVFTSHDQIEISAVPPSNVTKKDGWIFFEQGMGPEGPKSCVLYSTSGLISYIEEQREKKILAKNYTLTTRTMKIDHRVLLHRINDMDSKPRSVMSSRDEPIGAVPLSCVRGSQRFTTSVLSMRKSNNIFVAEEGHLLASTSGG
jgi:hypothetical protein